MKKYLDPKYTPVAALSPTSNGNGKAKASGKAVKAGAGAAKKK